MSISPLESGSPREPAESSVPEPRTLPVSGPCFQILNPMYTDVSPLPGQGTQPGTTGHNRTFIYLAFWRDSWDNPHQVTPSVAWIPGKRSPLSSGGTRGLSGAGKPNANFPCTACQGLAAVVSSPTATNWQIGWKDEPKNSMTTQHPGKLKIIRRNQQGRTSCSRSPLREHQCRQ